MTPPRAPVNPVRRYDARARRRKADLRRAAALDAAHHLFLAAGYLATPVEAIAAGAGVSAATVYKSYGGKPGLLRELCARALAGEGEIPAERRSDALRVGATPRDLLRGWGSLLAEVSPRISPLLLLLQEAARTDAEAAELRDEVEEARMARMADNAAALMRTGPLRTGLTIEEARDVLWLASAPELYDLLVRRLGWTVARYAQHVTEMMCASLLDAG